MNDDQETLLLAYEQATKIHEQVCDIHHDHAVMNSDGTCSECQDHHSELLIEFWQ